MNTNGYDDNIEMSDLFDLAELDENNDWYFPQNNELEAYLPLEQNSPQIFPEPNFAHYFKTHMSNLNPHFSTIHENQSWGFSMQNLTSTGAQETLFAVENASEHTTKGGEGDAVLTDVVNSIGLDEFAADLDEKKVENNDSSIGCVDASNTNAKVTEGSSKSNYHGGHRRGKKRDASEHTTKGGEGDAIRTDLVNSTALDEFAADLDEKKVKNNDSSIGCVDASNTNAKVTEGSSKTKSKNHGGYRRGNKKDGPATNVPAERRRREKLNKHLRELRSVVPKISTMSQASVLQDAIDYMKELRQKISELEHQLELLPPAAASPVATGRFSQLTPNAATIPSCSTKDLGPIREPARVDVQQMKNGVLDIHILCSPKPDLLYLISKTLEDLGLTIQDAMIANFDVFKLDLLAQQSNEGQYVKPDQIKVILLDLVGDRGAPEV